MEIEDLVRYENEFLSVKSRDEAKKLMEGCQSSEVMISTHNPDGIYNDVSGSCKDFVGYTEKELIGTSPYDYFHPEDFQKILKSHAKITIRPEVDRVEYRIKQKDGSNKHVRSLSRQIKDPSGLEFILAITFNNA